MNQNDQDLLAKIIDEIRKNCVGVVWNYGFDNVLFIDRSIDGKKSLEDILKENLPHDKNQTSNTSF